MEKAVELSKAKAILQYELTPEAIAGMVTEYDSLSVVPGDLASYKTVRAAGLRGVGGKIDGRRKIL